MTGTLEPAPPQWPETFTHPYADYDAVSDSLLIVLGGQSTRAVLADDRQNMTLVRVDDDGIVCSIEVMDADELIKSAKEEYRELRKQRKMARKNG
jgi:uncharacterized protein YuzE